MLPQEMHPCTNFTQTGTMAPNPLGDRQETAPIPPRVEDRIFNISIREVDHGYFVEVGCKTFAIESAERLMTLLNMYITSPAKIMEEFFKGKLFNK